MWHMKIVRLAEQSSLYVGWLITVFIQMESWNDLFLFKSIDKRSVTLDLGQVIYSRGKGSTYFRAFGLKMNIWLLVCVFGIVFGQDFQDLLDEVNSTTVAYMTCVCVLFLNHFSRLNLTSSCWVLLQGPFHLTSQAGCWGFVGQMWINILSPSSGVLLVKCGGSIFLSPSSGATWEGGWWRSQRQSRIPIGLSEDCYVVVLTLFYHFLSLFLSLLAVPGLPSMTLVAQWSPPWWRESLRIHNWKRSR